MNGTRAGRAAARPTPAATLRCVILLLLPACSGADPEERVSLPAFGELPPPASECLEAASGIEAPPRWQLSQDPVVQMGPEAPDGSDALHLVFALDRSDRAFLVGRWNAPVLRIDRRTGAWTAIGAEGEGPGEYLIPLSVRVLPQDSVMVFHDQGPRATVYGPDGAAVRSTRVAAGGGALPAAVLRDGASLWIDGQVAPNVEERTGAELRVLASSGTLRARMTDLQSSESTTLRLTPATGPPANVGVSSPFETAWSAVAEDSTFLVGHSSLPWLWRLDADGTPNGGRCLPLDTRLLDDATLQRGLARAYPEEGTLPGLDLAPARVEAARLQRSDRYPYFRRMLGDRWGRLWVERFPRAGGSSTGRERARYETGGVTEWWIVSPTGEAIGSLTHAERFTPFLVRGDTLIGVERGTLGEEAIVGYLVQEQPPA